MAGRGISRRGLILTGAAGIASLFLPSGNAEARGIKQRSRRFLELLKTHQKAAARALKDSAPLLEQLNGQKKSADKLRSPLKALAEKLEENRRLLARLRKGKHIPPPKQPEFGLGMLPDMDLTPQPRSDPFSPHGDCPNLFNQLASSAKAAYSIMALRLSERDGSYQLEDHHFSMKRAGRGIRYLLSISGSGYQVSRIVSPKDRSWEKAEIVRDSGADGIRETSSWDHDMFSRQEQTCKGAWAGGVVRKEKRFKQQDQEKPSVDLGLLGQAASLLRIGESQANRRLLSMIREVEPSIRSNLAELRAMRMHLAKLVSKTQREALSLGRRLRILEMKVIASGRRLVEAGYPNALYKLRNVKRSQGQPQVNNKNTLSVYFDTAKADISEQSK